LAAASISKSNGWIGELANPWGVGVVPREGQGLNYQTNGGESSGSGRLGGQLNTAPSILNSNTWIGEHADTWGQELVSKEDWRVNCPKNDGDNIGWGRGEIKHGNIAL